MNLTIEYDWRAAPDGLRRACGVVVIDADAARPVHEAGYLLPDAGDDESAALGGLLVLLDRVAPLKPRRLDLRCADRRLVDQITTGAAVGREAGPLFDLAMRRLLQLDNWQISLQDDERIRRAAHLSEQALNADADVVAVDLTESPRQHKRQYTGVPQWTVKLLEDPGPHCPARCGAGRKYPFGPDTPPGFCVYAARVALDDGPLAWSDAQQRRMTTVCPHCEAPMRIERVD